MCIHYTNLYYIFKVRTSIYSYKHFMLYTYITSWNTAPMKHRRVNVKMKNDKQSYRRWYNYRTWQPSNVEEMSLELSLQWSKRVSRYSVSESSASVKVSISRSKKKGRLVAKDCDNKLWPRSALAKGAAGTRWKRPVRWGQGGDRLLSR